MKGIQIGISFEEKNNGSVITLPQTGRIILVNERQATDILLTDKIQFAPGTNDGLRTVQPVSYTHLVAYDFINGKLVKRWEHISDIKGEGTYGQGNHNLAVADVDGDGCDEIIYGSCAINNDGTLL